MTGIWFNHAAADTSDSFRGVSGPRVLEVGSQVGTPGLLVSGLDVVGLEQFGDLPPGDRLAAIVAPGSVRDSPEPADQFGARELVGAAVVEDDTTCEEQAVACALVEFTAGG